MKAISLKKGQLAILVANVAILVVFAFVFLGRKNYEFMIYVGVVLFFLLLILYTNKRVDYQNNVLWGLTIWSLLHMIGGGVLVDGKVMYVKVLMPLIGEPYNILKYDQVVHVYGFAIATLVMYQLIKPLIKEENNKWKALSVVVVMAGLGAGALNEIVEFIATVVVPETNVGGYINTSLDLVSNLIGAIFAMIYIYLKNAKRQLTK